MKRRGKTEAETLYLKFKSTVSRDNTLSSKEKIEKVAKYLKNIPMPYPNAIRKAKKEYGVQDIPKKKSTNIEDIEEIKENKFFSKLEELQYNEMIAKIQARKEEIVNTVILESQDFIITIEPKDKRLFNDGQRTEIYLRDKAICQICLSFVTIGNFEADHIVPYSLGGESSIDNGQCACRRCNRSKGNRV